VSAFELPLRILASSACLASIFACAWAIVFQVSYGAFLAFLAFLVFLPLFWHKRAAWIARAIAFCVFVVLVSLTARLPIAEVNGRIRTLAEKPRDDHAAFTFQDKLGIYGLNLVMAAIAWPLYPECSRETRWKEGMRLACQLSGESVYVWDPSKCTVTRCARWW
jgi:hypothetical protein